MCKNIRDILSRETNRTGEELYDHITEVTRLKNIAFEKDKVLKEKRKTIRLMRYSMYELEERITRKNELIMSIQKELSDKDNLILEQKIDLTKKSILISEKDSEILQLKKLLLEADIEIPATKRSMVLL